MSTRGARANPASVAAVTDQLARRLGTGPAVMIGRGSMMGAGVFAAFGPAASAAGGGQLVGLAIAALVAVCNALSSAQLAAAYPTSGGTYMDRRERLGPRRGYLAGWGFVVGKLASGAAMALTFAVAAVVGLAALAVLVGARTAGPDVDRIGLGGVLHAGP